MHTLVSKSGISGTKIALSGLVGLLYLVKTVTVCEWLSVYLGISSWALMWCLHCTWCLLLSWCLLWWWCVLPLQLCFGLCFFSFGSVFSRISQKFVSGFLWNLGNKDCGPEQSWLNLGSDSQYILDILLYLYAVQYWIDVSNECEVGILTSYSAVCENLGRYTCWCFVSSNVAW